MMKRFCAPLVAAFVMLAGCLSMPAYVDPALGELQPADRVQVTEKRPVQLVFGFQTNGAANTMVTSIYAGRAADLVTASGIFSQVSSSPVPGGAVLSITINNVAESSFTQGVMTGLTFGLAPRSSVTDFYIATATYTPGPSGRAISVEKRHAVHSAANEASIPEGIRPARSFEEAIETMARQLFDHTLNDIARDPSFQSGGARSQPSPSAQS